MTDVNPYADTQRPLPPNGAKGITLWFGGTSLTATVITALAYYVLTSFDPTGVHGQQMQQLSAQVAAIGELQQQSAAHDIKFKAIDIRFETTETQLQLCRESIDAMVASNERLERAVRDLERASARTREKVGALIGIEKERDRALLREGR